MAEGFQTEDGPTEPVRPGRPAGSPTTTAPLEGRGRRPTRASYHPAAIAEARRRHGRALRTVAAGYLGAASSAPRPGHRRATSATGARGIVDRAFADVAKVHLDTDGVGRSSEVGMFVTLCTLIRHRAIGATGDPEEGSPPAGLVDLLVTADGPQTDDPETDDIEVRRTALGAYGTLEDRDRVLLWFVAVEGAVPVALAERLSIDSVDTAAALTHRARSRLRRSYASRRIAAPGWPAACADHARELVRIADGDLPGDPASVEVAHHRVCARCSRLLRELTALPGPIATEAAIVGRGILAARASSAHASPTANDAPDPNDGAVAGPGVVTGPAADTPLVITTTPSIDDTRTLAVDAAPGRHRAPAPDSGHARTPAADPEPDADATRAHDPVHGPAAGRLGADVVGRHRGPILVAVAAIVVVVALGSWLAFGRFGGDPAHDDPGAPVATTKPLTVTTATPTTRETGTTTTGPATSTTLTAAVTTMRPAPPRTAAPEPVRTPPRQPVTPATPGPTEPTTPETTPDTVAPTTPETVPPTDAPATTQPGSPAEAPAGDVDPAGTDPID